MPTAGGRGVPPRLSARAGRRRAAVAPVACAPANAGGFAVLRALAGGAPVPPGVVVLRIVRILRKLVRQARTKGPLIPVETLRASERAVLRGGRRNHRRGDGRRRGTGRVVGRGAVRCITSQGAGYCPALFLYCWESWGRGGFSCPGQALSACTEGPRWDRGAAPPRCRGRRGICRASSTAGAWC